MGANLLLNQTCQISKKYDEIYKNTGTHFNIFSIAHIESDEVTICRVIKELIDPKGTHYQGATYLELFMKYVLGRNDFGIEDLESAIVEREKSIVGKRRIDLFIKVPGQIEVPIEVKIYAGDQELQCYDYYKYTYNAKLYYLTLDGHKPSNESLKDLHEDCIQCISFGKEILNWLSECLNVPETIRIAPIREIIIQLIGIVRKLTNQTESKMEREILDLIMKSKESFRSAELISTALKTAEKKIFDKFFKAIHQCICETYPHLKENLAAYNLADEEDEEYDQNGIFYPVKSLADENILYLHITCEQTLYAGFRVCDKEFKDLKSRGYIEQAEVMTGDWNSADYWIAWKYLAADMDERPNFKYHNNSFYELLNDTFFESFVQTSMQTIDELMNSLK